MTQNLMNHDFLDEKYYLHNPGDGNTREFLMDTSGTAMKLWSVPNCEIFSNYLEFAQYLRSWFKEITNKGNHDPIPMN